MTDHPCKGMTTAQIAAFERIAINQSPVCGMKTMDALLKRGVVVKSKDEWRRDAVGPYPVTTFYVPLPIHAQWCEWASEQPEPVE